MLCLEEQPLDLSLKSKPFEKEINRNSGEYSYNNFNFEEFYRTYLAISVRSWNIQQHQGQELPDKPLAPFPSRLYQSPVSPPVKRKLSGEFDNEAKKLKLETAKHDAKINKIIKRKKKEEISQIKTSCDCRFCYEDHIKKLRVKSDVPWSII